MADDEDDESFGEFTFASNQMPVNSSEWGDFSFIQNNTTDPQPQPNWAKIKGALPLSLFGEGEEEEEDVDSGFVSSDNNDLIANLYAQTQQQQTIEVPLSLSAAAAGNHGSDDEGGWEFRDAYSDSKLAHNESGNKERLQESVSPLHLQDGSQGSIDLFAAPNNGYFVESHVMDSGFDANPMTTVQSGVTVDLKADSKCTATELDSSPLGGSVDTDDTFGDFESAFTEQPSKKKEEYKENFPLGSRDASQGRFDLFASPNGSPAGSHKEDNGFDFRRNSVVENGVASDPFSQIEWKETKDGSDSQPHDGSGDDEAAFPESGSKLEGHDASSKNYKEAVPLSIFGIEEEPQANSSFNLEHELFKSSTHGKSMVNQSSNLSINDILSDLYSQAEPISSTYHEHNTDGKLNVLHSTDKEHSSQIVDDDDDDNFNSGSWGFNDAFSQSRVENQSLSFNEKLNNCMTFYSNLKDELSVAARRQFQSLKKARSTAALAGEETKVAAVDKEIQEALEELHQQDIISTEGQSDDERIICLEKYMETLNELNFQVLESEYHISRRLSSAETDLRTAIDLINHSTTVLKLLTLVPKDEPANYVSIWFKMLSVCSEELKHGTWIWKKSLEQNVHSEILSQPQGKHYIIALGEIYRAVVIIGAAVKLYKPWILLSSADSKGVYVLLEECRFLWSTSGLEEAISVGPLLESIRHIQNLDALALAIQVLSQEESQCRMSLLSPGVVPGVSTYALTI